MDHNPFFSSPRYLVTKTNIIKKLSDSDNHNLKSVCLWLPKIQIIESESSDSKQPAPNKLMPLPKSFLPALELSNILILE